MDKTPAEVAGLANKHGFDFVEIRLDERGGFGGSLDARSIRALFKDVKILSLNTGITVNPGNPLVEQIKTAASFAAACGAEGIRIFADPKGNAEALAESIVISSLAARGEGTELLIETHGELTSTDDMIKLLGLTNGSFNVIWDVLHTLESGETVDMSARNLKGSVSHVHLKDAVKTDVGYRMTALGEGVIEPAAIRDLLDGEAIFSLEWEEFWHKELRGIYRDTDELLLSYLDWLK